MVTLLSMPVLIEFLTVVIQYQSSKPMIEMFFSSNRFNPLVVGLCIDET